MNPLAILSAYYQPGSRAYQILVSHSRSVRDKALALAEAHPELELDRTMLGNTTLISPVEIY